MWSISKKDLEALKALREGNLILNINTKDSLAKLCGPGTGMLVNILHGILGAGGERTGKDRSLMQLLDSCLEWGRRFFRMIVET